MTDGGDETGDAASREPETPESAPDGRAGERGGDEDDGADERAGRAAADPEAAVSTASDHSGQPDQETPDSGSGRSDSSAGEAREGAGQSEGNRPGAEQSEGDQSGADHSDDGRSEPTGPAAGESAADQSDAGGAETGGDVPGPADLGEGQAGESAVPDPADVPPDVRKYDRFKKIDGSTYDRANEFLRDRTYITAREWAIARLCADFRTETGVEMTKIGEHLPQLVPFMTDTYSPQAVNQARHAFEEKVRKAGATFLYGAMCDFFTAEELDDVMYEATEVAKFLLEVEGVDLAVEEELAAEDRISSVMREVRQSSAALRHDEVRCPECGHSFEASDGDHAVESAEGGD